MNMVFSHRHNRVLDLMTKKNRQRCVTFQKKEDLIYIATKAWNHIQMIFLTHCIIFTSDLLKRAKPNFYVLLVVTWLYINHNAEGCSHQWDENWPVYSYFPTQTLRKSRTAFPCEAKTVHALKYARTPSAWKCYYYPLCWPLNFNIIIISRNSLLAHDCNIEFCRRVLLCVRKRKHLQWMWRVFVVNVHSGTYLLGSNTNQCLPTHNCFVCQ